MQFTMSVVESSKVAKINKSLDSSVVGVCKKKSFKKLNIKKNNIIICGGSLRGDKMTTMFGGMMCRCRVA